MSENESAQSRWTKSNNQIFSQEALDKMRSPEKLDEIMPITTPITWMGLVAVVVSMFAVVLWSIFGAFTVKAEGMGLIMDPHGISNITAVFGGRLDKLYIHFGQKIKKGDRVAHIEQTQEDASTRMAQYGPELATSELDAMNRVHEFDARRYQKDEAEFIYSSYDGIVDEILAEEGSTVGGGSPICSVRLTGGRKDLTGILLSELIRARGLSPVRRFNLRPTASTFP